MERTTFHLDLFSFHLFSHGAVCGLCIRRNDGLRWTLDLICHVLTIIISVDDLVAQ